MEQPSQEESDAEVDQNGETKVDDPRSLFLAPVFVSRVFFKDIFELGLPAKDVAARVGNLQDLGQPGPGRTLRLFRFHFSLPLNFVKVTKNGSGPATNEAFLCSSFSSLQGSFGRFIKIVRSQKFLRFIGFENNKNKISAKVADDDEYNFEAKRLTFVLICKKES